MSKIDSIKRMINNDLLPSIEKETERQKVIISNINDNKSKISSLENEISKLKEENKSFERECETIGNYLKSAQNNLLRLKQSLVDAVLNQE